VQQWFDSWRGLLESDAMPTVIVFAVLLVCTGIELAVPAEEGQGWTGRLRNLAYMFVFKLLGLAGVAVWVSSGPFPSLARHEPTPLAAAALVIASLFASDFLYYWYHRAQHRFQLLWAIHELHHADSELNVTTSYRTYWLEAPVQAILIATPTLVLFGDLGPGHALAFFVAAQFFLIFSHCNFRLSLGPLSSIVCGPQVHRIHHSRLPAHQDRNFAQVFPLIDRLFGSYYGPARGEFPPTGAPGLASDAPLATAMTQPLALWAQSLGFTGGAPEGSIVPGARARSDRSTRKRSKPKRSKRRRGR